MIGRGAWFWRSPEYFSGVMRKPGPARNPLMGSTQAITVPTLSQTMARGAGFPFPISLCPRR
jgi:hypothetical protein